MVGRIFIILLMIFTMSCGGSSTSSTAPAPAPAPAPQDFTPEAMTNQHFRMTVTNGDIQNLLSFMPSIEQDLIHYIDRADFIYVQSDQYSAWQLDGSYTYTSLEDNHLRFAVTLPEHSVEYEVNYQFDSATNGTWTSVINTESYAGTFTFGDNLHPRDYNFQGTLERNQNFLSTITDIDYPFHVYLPPNYENNPQDFPVLLFTDGQSGHYRHEHIIETSGKEVIFIALEQGPSGRREVDFLTPTSDPYFEFLETEFLPFIQNNYRIDKSQITLMGYSFGGVLVRSAMLNEIQRITNNQDRLFKNFVSADSSYWWDPTTFRNLENQSYGSDIPFPAKFFLSGALFEGNGPVVASYLEQLRNYSIPELEIEYKTYNTDHNHVRTPTFRSAINFIYPEPTQD